MISRGSLSFCMNLPSFLRIFLLVFSLCPLEESLGPFIEKICRTHLVANYVSASFEMLQTMADKCDRLQLLSL